MSLKFKNEESYALLHCLFLAFNSEVATGNYNSLFTMFGSKMVKNSNSMMVNLEFLPFVKITLQL